ncbi:MAG: sigma-70 family RNA polymerase sigma factor [Candidatus Pseudobacter hemicellulosilyticus]|uniref:Sigma-70 family RNA polymerase sigma factor n=1 Tax=Candidatus Pseudobacter hemicellulosilyticus TaxID=3121375 RepID=A0AAJ5WQ68_9BACT|nr:MAG: sigma-70 family RNA polymerase sigma factor [Pseudobacter sp.]
MKNDLHTDQELFRLVANGDANAFSVLVARYTSVIYAQLLLYLKNAPRAEEATQDIFMSIWRNREKLPGMENFAGYVYVTTRNKLHTLIREKVLATVEPPEDRLHSVLAGPESVVQVKELQQAIHTGINLLPPRRKEVFQLSRLEHKSYEEIADQLGISRTAVKQHISAAMVFLRTYLQKELDLVILALLWYAVSFS